MKKLILTMAILSSLPSQAGILDSLFSTKSPAEKCVELTTRNYGKDKQLILGCQKHISKYANKCIEIIINSNSQMHPKTPEICSYINNKHGVKALEEFSIEYKNKIKS